MKKTIRLTESDLHRIVKESVKRVLKEDSDEDVYSQVKMLCERFIDIFTNHIDYIKQGNEELVGGEDIKNSYFKVVDAFSELLNIFKRMGIDSYYGESFGGLE